MNNKKHTSGGIAGKGYYIALILCAAAIGISGYLYYRNANSPQNTQLNNPTVPGKSSDQVEAIAARPPIVPEQDTVTTGTEPTERKPLRTTSPVHGDIVEDYAMDCLSYNNTTRDWRVHNGIDIQADAGTSVVAAADGKVYTVYEDDTMGTTVVIRHEGGYTSHYASLAQELKVAPGDTVSMGQAIGCVGTSALLETAQGPHVHFSVTFQDEPMDPGEFLELG